MSQEKELQEIESIMEANDLFVDARLRLEKSVETLTKAQEDMANALDDIKSSAKKLGSRISEFSRVNELKTEREQAINEIDAWLTAVESSRAPMSDSCWKLSESLMFLDKAYRVSKGEQ